MVELTTRRPMIGRRSPGEGGRHAIGRPYIPVAPGRPDPRARAEAALLDRLEPAWTILYGPWSRRFYAIALFPTPHGLIVHAATPNDLTRLMRETEGDVLAGAGAYPAGGGW